MARSSILFVAVLAFWGCGPDAGALFESADDGSTGVGVAGLAGAPGAAGTTVVGASGASAAMGGVAGSSTHSPSGGVMTGPATTGGGLSAGGSSASNVGVGGVSGLSQGGAATGGTGTAQAGIASGGIASGGIASGGGVSTSRGGSLSAGGSGAAARAGTSGAGPSAANCDGTMYEGVCWYVGDAGESCNEFCSAHGGIDVTGATYVGTRAQGGSLAECTAILRVLGYEENVESGTRSDGIGAGCYLLGSSNPAAWWQSAPSYSPDASLARGRLVCGCTE